MSSEGPGSPEPRARPGLSGSVQPSGNRPRRHTYKAQRPRVGRALLGLVTAAVVIGAVLVGMPLVMGKGHPTGSPACRPSAVLSSWPLQRLANQTIVVPAGENKLSGLAPAARAGYAGVLLFGARAPKNLKRQLAGLRRVVPGHLGWLVMTDEEGGGVQRMANLVGSLPWASRMGRSDNPARIQALAKAVGLRMLANGVNMDLAPVLDVDGRPVLPGPGDPDGLRSFSGKTAIATADGIAFMRGMLEAGVIPVVKHFPGLGGVSRNTDSGPAWTLAWTTLKRVALPAFAAAVAAGTPAVMMSNARVHGFTHQPASLSPRPALFLRQNLHFKGLIVTDSLSASAISQPPERLSVAAASVRSLQAGDDLILFGPTASAREALSLAARTSAAIVAAVKSKALSLSQLVAAATHVLVAKRVNVCAVAGA